MKKRATTYLLPLAVILIGFLLRAYRPDTYPFGFDQIQIAENAQKILAGHPALIGPRTGPATMHTGPLIYYLAVPFFFIIHSPYALVATTLFITTITGVSIYFLAKSATSFSEALLLTLIWACSLFLINLDRVPWNPDLSILAASLVFFPYLKAQQKKQSLQPLDIFCVTLGVFLGYQAHFSGLILIGLALIGWLLYARDKKLLPLLYIAAWILSLLPTVVFDLRHQWLNLNGIIEFAGNADHVSRFQSLYRLLKMAYISLENQGKILLAFTQAFYIISAGGFLIATYIAFTLSHRRTPTSRFPWLPLLWIGSIMVAFSLYRGETPEYYFLVEMPALLYIATAIIWTLCSTATLRTIVAATLIVSAIGYVNHYTASPRHFPLGSQMAIAANLKSLSPETKKIVYDTSPLDALGVQFLLKDTNIGTGPYTVHVIFPYTPNSAATKKFENAAYWIDERIHDNSSYVLSNRHVVESPPEITLYQSSNVPDIYKNTDRFLVARQGQIIGSLEIVPRRITADNDPLIVTCTDEKANGYITIEAKSIYRKCLNTLVLFYIPHTPTPEQQIVTLLDSLKISYYDATTLQKD